MLKDTTVGIVGNGVVGGATGRAMLEYVKEVRVYDTNPLRRTHPLEKVLECDLTFICLPTPQREGSLACDTTILEEFFSCTTSYWANANLVLRSTVPVGFTRRMREEYGLVNLVHSPEFLTARCADQDAAMPNRLVIGTPGWKGTAHNSLCTTKLEDLYLQRFGPIPCLLMTSDESEALKLFTNSFYAVKVAYFNEVHAYATNLGLDWEAIHGAVQQDRHINPAHTQVPGPDGKYGFGGACLPKDLASLIEQMIHADSGSSYDVDAAWVTMAAYMRNQDDRQRVE